MEDRTITLRAMQICRFCLTEKDPLSNIYERTQNGIPLPLQIMGCVTIEVFASDGMPQLICDDCQLQTRMSYSFKTMCKRSDDSLKLYLATGVLTKQEKEDILLLATKSVKRTSESENLQTIKRAKLNEDEVPVKTMEDKATETIENNEQLQQHKDGQVLGATDTLDSEMFEVQIPNAIPKQVTTHCFSCTHCERSFPLQQLLDIHMRQHTRERKFECSECDKKFFTKHDLTKHLPLHTGEKPFACVICDKSFLRATLLHRHEKIHVSVPKYLCTYCDKTYLTSDDLDMHMVTHKRKRPYKCDRCDKSFAFKQGLERHEPSHTAEANPYKCNYCDESFTTAGKLARHVTSHAGARPFPCKLCPRTFLLSHHLTRHLRNHYNRRANLNDPGEHKCDVCSMSFRRKDSLVNHMAIHSMVNLKCLICNKEFTDAKTVKEHVTTHLYGLPYPCDKCVYSFESQVELEEHEAKHVGYEGEEDDEDDEYVEEVLDEDPLEESPVRRSKRETKIKNYADFLKDELGPDSEEEESEPEEQPEPPVKIQTGTIQPVVRNENVRVYQRKSTGEPKLQPEPIILNKLQENSNTPMVSLSINEPQPKSLTKITTLENLGISKEALEQMTEKSGFVEMKLGQKMIRVQKLMMTKTEYQAMAKRGKLEMKGSTIVVQNKGSNLDLKKLNQMKAEVKDAEQKIANESDFDPLPVSKTPVRTYVKKIMKGDEEGDKIRMQHVQMVPTEVPEHEISIDLEDGEIPMGHEEIIIPN